MFFLSPFWGFVTFVVIPWLRAFHDSCFYLKSKLYMAWIGFQGSHHIFEPQNHPISKTLSGWCLVTRRMAIFPTQWRAKGRNWLGVVRTGQFENPRRKKTTSITQLNSGPPKSHVFTIPKKSLWHSGGHIGKSDRLYGQVFPKQGFP